MPNQRIRDLGYGPGYYTPGPLNSIFDVPGVQVGMHTIHDQEKGVHVGVTLIYPRGVENTRKQPSYAAIHTLNGGGEMTGTHFIQDWGFSSSPIAFTDSMSLGTVYQALTNYSFKLARELGEDAATAYSHHTWPTVAETWGGGVTDIQDFKSTLTYEQVIEAVEDAKTRTAVSEGSHGGGSGMLCLGHKGGTGTSSRLVPQAEGEDFAVGVLVQTNFGELSMLTIGGAPVGKELCRKLAEQNKRIDVAREVKTGSEGSIVVCVITNAPLLPHQLRRLAARACWGIHSCGGNGVGYNTSGDIIIALSTSEQSKPQVLMKSAWNRPDNAQKSKMGGRTRAEGDMQPGPSGGGFRRVVESGTVSSVNHSGIDSLFVAAAEACEEAILNSMTAAEQLVGHDGTIHKALDGELVKQILQKYSVGDYQDL